LRVYAYANCDTFFAARNFSAFRQVSQLA